MPNPIVWNRPKGTCSAKIAGVEIPPSMPVSPGMLISVSVVTFCGLEVCELVISPTEISTCAQVVRQSQIAASIQHVERRKCDGCIEAFFRELSPSEKAWLYASDPKLGPVLGISHKGLEGVI